MAEPFADWEDLQRHWPQVPADAAEEATNKLDEASVEIRGLYPNIDRRLAAGTITADALRLVTVRVVKRALDAPAAGAGVGQITNTTGPFSQALHFTNPDGNIYLSKADRRLLEGGRRTGQAFTVHPNPGRRNRVLPS